MHVHKLYVYLMTLTSMNRMDMMTQRKGIGGGVGSSNTVCSHRSACYYSLRDAILPIWACRSMPDVMNSSERRLEWWSSLYIYLKTRKHVHLSSAATGISAPTNLKVSDFQMRCRKLTTVATPIFSDLSFRLHRRRSGVGTKSIDDQNSKPIVILGKKHDLCFKLL